MSALTRLLATLTLAALAVGASAQSSVFSWKWIQEHIIDRIQLSGYRTLGFRSYTIDGDRDAYNSLNNFGYGAKRFSDIGRLSIGGRNVADVATFQAQVDTNRYTDPQAQNFLIDVNKKPYRLQIGDFSGSLVNSNRFASFSKSLNGVSAGYESGRLRLRTVFSESKGSPRTISIQGANSAGPYYLNAGQVIRGSEEVLLDGVAMRLGEDYVVNYEAGSITFISRIIPPTSTIVISFEAFGFNADRGTIVGAGATYDFGKVGRLGLTVMRQESGAGDQLSQRVELFQGGGAASTPYFLQFEPLESRPITVKLDGVPQFEHVDYEFDDENPTIFYFLRFVSLSSTIEVVYTPKPTQTVTGDREVLGVDYRIPIKGGWVTYYQATGQLKSDVNPMKGTARGMDANVQVGRYRLRAGWRNVPNNFVSVETRGFNRNEKAYDLGAEWEMRGMRIESNHVDSDVSIRRTLSNGTVTFSNSATQTSRFAIENSTRVGEPWRLEATRQKSTSTAGETLLNSITAGTSRNFGPVLTRLAIDSQFGRGPVSDGIVTSVKDLSIFGARLEGSYTDGEHWSFNGRAGLSQVNVGGKEGVGQDYSLSANYEHSTRFSSSATFIRSDSGAVAALTGFGAASGIGYNGNGFSGGMLGTPLLSGASDLTQIALTSSYELNPSVSLSLSAYQQKAAGSVSSNTQSDGFSFFVDARLSSKSRAFLELSQSATKFIDSPQRSNATMYSLGVTGQIGTKWNYDLRGMGMKTGGSSDFSQDNWSVSALASYLLAPRHRLGSEYRFSRTTGYNPQEDLEIEFSHAYRIWQSLNLVSSYRIRNVTNLDGSPSGAYRARGFDIELRFAF